MTVEVDALTMPFLPPRSIEARLKHFCDTYFVTDESTNLFKFIDALIGDGGAGSLKKQTFIQRLQGRLDTMFFGDLDNMFGSIALLWRLPSESYNFDPQTQMLTADEWNEVMVKDAWYRARVRDFFVACGLGGTPEGMRMMVHSALGVGCDLYETWRYCADDATEILTKQGYKSYTDLNVGDMVLTYNVTNDRSEWQPVLKINTFDVVDEAMLSLESMDHSSLTTMDHRWPVRRRTTDKKYRFDIKRSYQLTTEDMLIRSARCDDIPVESSYRDEFVELLGWFITEGHINKEHGKPTNFVTISQSNKVNPQKVDRIRVALRSLYGPPSNKLSNSGPKDKKPPMWRESVSESKSDITVFRLNSSIGKDLLLAAPERIVDLNLIHSLTKNQLELFVDTCIQGDGHTRKDGYRSYVQKSLDAIEPVRLAATLLGIATSIKKNGNCYVLSLCEKRRFVAPHRKNSGMQKYTGVVWCPTTKNGTWLARRGMSVYFTGNTDNYGITDVIGRGTTATFRNEVIVKPYKSSITQKEKRLVLHQLDKIKPSDSIVTVDLEGAALHIPVTPLRVAASSEYFEIEKEVTGTSDIAKLPSPEVLQSDLDASAFWMEANVTKVAPSLAFSVPQEYSQYYTFQSNRKSVIDQVQYKQATQSPLENENVTPEDSPIYTQVVSLQSKWSDWETIPLADSPDNFPGGKGGSNPYEPNPNYVFPYASQEEFVAKFATEKESQGWEVLEDKYRYPVAQEDVNKNISYPAYLSIATKEPLRDSTVVSPWIDRA